jgi:uncharacterized protein (TIGR02145 family)
MKSFISAVCGLFVCISIISGQGVSVNESGDPADSSAMLDVSSITKGMLIPSMTQVQRNAISSPATGLIIFQTDNTPGFYFYNGSAWVLIGNEALSVDDLIDGSITGNSLFIGTGTGQNDDGTENKNVGIGIDAMYDNIQGYFNTSVGYRALYENLDGRNNTSIGYRSLYYNTTGDYNTGIGFQALYKNTGNRNTALGNNALFDNENGSNNTAAGYGALYRNTSGGMNVGIGYYTNYYNQTGSSNTMIGYQAGRGTTYHSKSGNIFIGYNAGYYDTTDNKLYIENSSSSSPLIYGEFDNDILAVNGSLGIGTQSPHTSAELEIESTTRGILISRMTKSQRDAISSPATGLLIYQTDNSPGFYSYDGSKWKPMTVLGTGQNEPGEAGIGNSYGTVVNDVTGRVWLDRNLGASQVATSSTDTDAYGDLYQWGRAAEGHQEPTSSTFAGPVSTWRAGVATNSWDGMFVTSTLTEWLDTPVDEIWAGSEAENNPCPSGFRIPTLAEWVQEVLTWSSQNAVGAFASPLKLPMGGYRLNDGVWTDSGARGAYWSSTPSSGTDSHYRLWFNSSDADLPTGANVQGSSVRCIKE